MIRYGSHDKIIFYESVRTQILGKWGCSYIELYNQIFIQTEKCISIYISKIKFIVKQITFQKHFY